jgi:predicted  nucleic acid-binding Zn-ribbon protein
MALDISWIDESFREMKEKIAKLEADIINFESEEVRYKLEAENEQYHQIVSDMSSQLRKAAEENERLRKALQIAVNSIREMEINFKHGKLGCSADLIDELTKTLEG